MLKKTTAKYSTVIQELRSKYGELIGEEYVPIYYSYKNIDLTTIFGLQSYDTKSKYVVTDVKPIKNNAVSFINHSIGGHALRVNTQKTSTIPKTTGMFVVTLQSSDQLIIAEYISQTSTAHEHIVNYVIGKKGVVQGLNKLCSQYNRVIQKRLQHDNDSLRIDSPGLYTVEHINTMAGEKIVIAKTKVKANTIPIIHPQIKTLYEDMGSFFSNVSLFKKYGQPGVRKILLVGPPGTGKTSIYHKVAREMKDKFAICSVTNISDAYFFLSAVAKSNFKGILFWEDAETSMRDTSEVLNFLDGIKQPKSKMGSYVIMTTNNPQEIAGRILKRPGRIDKYIFIGTLDGKDAADCFNIYVPKATKLNNEFLMDTLNDFTGAQIKEIAMSAKLYASSNGKKIDEDIVTKVVKVIRTGYTEIENFVNEIGRIMETEKKFGFYTPEPVRAPAHSFLSSTKKDLPF